MKCECAICKNNKPFEMPPEIIDAAINDDLVLFCGAGISTEKKTVLPFSFYSSVKEELDINDDNMSFCDLMQIYCESPNGRKKLLQKIRDRFDYIKSFPELQKMATTFHRELADIYSIKTIITTNWDTYFEDYCGALSITIPQDARFFDYSSRCVIKLHGSINNISSIVATKDDYDKCYDSLQSGAIGGLLKSILATKTVVFIGFSFGDDDLNRIIEILRSDMGELYPHLYFVTLDDSLAQRLKYKNATSIITDGTFFIHNLKLELQNIEFITNTFSLYVADILYPMIRELHEEVSSIKLKKYPEVIYTLAYQDGIIHAFERFYENNTGDYHIPNMISKTVAFYEEMAEQSHQNGNYWDEAYCEGYLNGVLAIGATEEEIESISSFPFLYLPNAIRSLDNLDIFYEELKRVSEVKDEYSQYAERIVNEKVSEGIVVHHPPYL